MRKRRLILLYVCTVFCLSGCRGHIFSGRMDMERLRPVQTMGLDRQGSGVVLTVSAGSGPEEEPLVLTGFASSIESAMDRLQDWSPEDELFYAHVSYILLGSGMTDDSVLPLLDWVERSPAMRMETPLIVVKGPAAEAVTGVSEGDGDVTEAVASMERELRLRGQHIPTLRETASALLERGGAVCLAAEALPADGIVLQGRDLSDALVPAGAALLRPGRPAVFLTADETLGVRLLSKEGAGVHVEIGDSVLEIISADTEAEGQRDADGRPEGILVRCRLEAGVLEQDALAAPERLEALLADRVRSCLRAAIFRSQALSCDFLDLERPVTGGRRDNWAEIFPALPVTVTVEAEIDRSYDLAS